VRIWISTWMPKKHGHGRANLDFHLDAQKAWSWPTHRSHVRWLPSAIRVCMPMSKYNILQLAYVANVNLTITDTVASLMLPQLE
jgi:hypothetical protein